MDSGLFISHTVKLVWGMAYVDAAYLYEDMPWILNAGYLVDPVPV